MQVVQAVKNVRVATCFCKAAVQFLYRTLFIVNYQIRAPLWTNYIGTYQRTTSDILRYVTSNFFGHLTLAKMSLSPKAYWHIKSRLHNESQI